MTGRVDADALADWAGAILQAAGADGPAAQASGTALVRANLRGIDTHGVARLPDYVRRLQAGHVRGAGTPHTTQVPGGFRMDADLALGQYAGAIAIDHAVAMAQDQAIVAGTIAHCGHLGALGLYALRAAEAGMIALICQETRPILRPAGAARNAIGNNPLAFAAPLRGDPPMVFDMAASAASHAKLVAAARTGEPIDPAWAVDAAGQPTGDPAAALAGGLSPVAGHKGLGLALMVQCLAGGLTGAGARVDEPGVAGSSAGDVGAFLLVINPLVLGGDTPFVDDMAQWFAGYDGAFADRGRYPGLNAARLEAERRAAGVPLDDATASLLAGLADGLSVAPLQL